MDKFYKIPKYNKELYLGGTLMKDLKNFIKPILFLTLALVVLSLFRSVDFRVMMTKIQNNIQEGLKVVKVTDEKSEINDENLSVYPISFILRKEGLCLYCYNTNNNEYVVVLINKISEITNLQKSCDLKLYKYGENKEKIKFIL